MLGQVIVAHRERLGLTQEALAQKTGLSARGLRDLEAGRVRAPRKSSVLLLADAFDLRGPEREQFYRQAWTGTEAPFDATPSRGDNPVVTPAQLPADVSAFTGRAEYLAGLDNLVSGADRRTSTAVVITAVSGTAGVGKTALAVHWAHRGAHLFPDGQLFIDLRGFDATDPAMSSYEALRSFLQALGVPAGQIPDSLDAQVGLYRSLLAGKKVLVVLDNARDAEQARPLLPGAAGCLAVVTSRNRLTSLVVAENAHHIIVDLLTVDESRQLLASRIGRHRVDAEIPAVDDIIDACARLPIALAVVAARAASQPEIPLVELGSTLRAEGGLHPFTDDDPRIDVRSVLSWSYRELGPSAARLFRLLGLHPGPDISIAAAASLTATSIGQVSTSLAELLRANLLTEHWPGRYALHDLLRHYAAELAQAHEPAGDRDAAVHRLLDHYLHTAHAVARVLYPSRESVEVGPPAAGAVPEPLVSHKDCRAWFAAERAVLLAAIELAARAGLDQHVWQLAWIFAIYLDRSGSWQALLSPAHLAMQAATRLRQPGAQALAHRLLARASHQIRRFDDALAHLEQALDLYRQTDDLVGQSIVQANIAIIHGSQDRHHIALDHSRRALMLAQTAGDRPRQAYVLNLIGWYHAKLGSHREALAYCQRSIALNQDLADRHGQAAAWDSLGLAYDGQGQYARAVKCFRTAVTLYDDLGERYLQADSLAHLGDAHHHAGQSGPARAAWRGALAILAELQHPGADPLRAKLTLRGGRGRPYRRGQPEGHQAGWPKAQAVNR
jgi:tetratricopeptide (TPR) repeat protein/transcriptional regulator with XRE-family HTH domain